MAIRGVFDATAPGTPQRPNGSIICALVATERAYREAYPQNMTRPVPNGPLLELRSAAPNQLACLRIPRPHVSRKEERRCDTDPTPESEKADRLFQASLKDLELQFKGGLTIAQHPTLFTAKAEAEIEAYGRLVAMRASQAIARHVSEGKPLICLSAK